MNLHFHMFLTVNIHHIFKFSFHTFKQLSSSHFYTLFAGVICLSKSFQVNKIQYKLLKNIAKILTLFYQNTEIYNCKILVILLQFFTHANNA